MTQSHSSEGKGFRATFSTNGVSCSGFYSTETGTITSPNFPSAYDSRDDCEYQISVSGLHDIQITLEEFEMPFSTNCSDSYLAIHDGQSADDPLLLRHCGPNLPTPNILRSTGSKVYMRMKANGNSVGKGECFATTRCVDSESLARLQTVLQDNVWRTATGGV